MKPAAFSYYAPTTVEEALTHLAQHGDDAKVLAGGQSLVPIMNFRLTQPSILIDLNRVEELFYLRPDDSGGLRIGAMTRQRHLERHTEVAKRAPLVCEAVPYIAHPQIRNRGTVGGSLAHADPAAELPAVMVALGARFLLRNLERERWIAAEDFFVDLFTTAIEPEELLTEIAVPPMPPRTGWAFREIARRHGDYALVGVAAMLTLDENNDQCKQARIVFLTAGNVPVEARQAEQVLKGQDVTEQAIEAAAETAAGKDIDPPGDLHASPAYRRRLARVLTVQALTQAVENARSSHGEPEP